MGAIHEIVFDCDEPKTLASFWASLLEGYSVRQLDTTSAALSLALGLDPAEPTTLMVDGPGPSLCFQNVDGQRPDNNRVHFDVQVADRAAEVERLKQAGASVERVLPTYTIMRDPEGNQFCLVDRREALAA
ncbi:VOC family protein [Devosia sp. YIM 151766]|uniref:VOC family protein n=1 Tax=Devosia sp. YIM 151766 TaxID=3017325 RepID=UPI00255CE9C8|nr:VOC family protein [Devosia sp. YIM 151766]WIY51876.1 VOC family protein [Devosia sp. YIM 151766]